MPLRTLGIDPVNPASLAADAQVSKRASSLFGPSIRWPHLARDVAAGPASF